MNIISNMRAKKFPQLLQWSVPKQAQSQPYGTQQLKVKVYVRVVN